MTNKDQTPVEWFFDKIKSHFEHDGDLFETLTFTYAIAKEKERNAKREIIEGFAEWYIKPGKYVARDVMNDIIDRYLKETSKTIEQ